MTWPRPPPPLLVPLPPPLLLQAVWVLRQYPLGRLAIFLYLASLHLFVYILLHRLQHRAFLAAEAEDAAALGGAAAHRDQPGT